MVRWPLTSRSLMKNLTARLEKLTGVRMRSSLSLRS
jgi:hypothetical protein